MTGVQSLLAKKTLKLSDPLMQIFIVPSFYPAFFGSNNKDVFKDLAQTLIQAAPRFPVAVDLI